MSGFLFVTAVLVLYAGARALSYLRDVYRTLTDTDPTTEGNPDG